MDAMKRSRAEVDDTDINSPAVIGRPVHLARHLPEIRLGQEHHYSVTPVFQMAISRSSLSSLREGLPEAVSRMRSISLAEASSRLVPSNTWPALKSIQRGFFCASAVLEAIFRVGTGKPSGVPRPVVNRRM